MPVTVTYVPPTGTLPGHNNIIGTAAPETIVGTTTHDFIFGLGGNDFIYGGDGVDLLDGGPGADGLTGGRGVDFFSFTTTAEANGDWILDFSRGDRDRISTELIDANVSIAGDQAFTWIGTAPFTAAGQLRYFQQGGNTIVEGNTGGNLVPELAFGVVGLVNFIPSDFVL